MNILYFLSDKTLNAIYAIVLLIILIVLLIISPLYRKNYLRELTIGYLLMSIAMGLLTLRNLTPDFISIIIANILTIVGEYYMIDAFLKLIHKKTKINYYISMLAIFTLVHVFFTYISPNVAIRIINYSIFLIIPSVYLIIAFFTINIKNKNLSFILIASTYGLIVISSLFRIINALGIEKINSLYRGASIFKVYLLISIVVHLSRIIIIMIINTKDLVHQ